MRSEAGYAKPRLRSLESLPSFCTECGSKAPNSNGHQRRPLISLHSRTTESPPTSGSQRPCRDAGVGEIALGLAMLKTAKRDSHIKHQRHLTPSCGGYTPTAERTLNPARMFMESLTPRPELENSQGHSRRLKRLAATSAITLNADIRWRCNICRNGPVPDSCTAAKTYLLPLV